MFHRVILILLAFNYINTTQTAKSTRSFNVEFNRVTCNNFTAPAKYLYCNVRKLDVNRYASDILAVLERDLLGNAEIGIRIHYQLPKGRKIVKFLDVKLNICDAMDQLRAMPMVKKLFIELMRASNLPYSCPIKGNRLYNMSDFILTEDLLPVYTPILSFNYTVSFYENHTQFASHNMEGATVPKYKGKY